MKFNQREHRYHSKRNAVYGKNGMVATSSPLAAQAGLEILKKGGNAIDAAVATAAMLTVVEPCSNGVGGDLFSIFHVNGKLKGLNSSGHAPEKMTIEAIKAKGYEDQITRFGFDPVTVPGIPAGWAHLVENYGKLSLATVLEPAAIMAETGFPMTPTIQGAFERARINYNKEREKYPALETWFNTYTNNGKVPQDGDIVFLKDLSKALREIGRSNGRSFYEGDIADAIDAFSKEHNGFITKEDLKDFYPTEIDPVSVCYRGVDVWELPPNGIGIVALMGLNILENFEMKERESVDTYHKQIESLKLAFEDGNRHIGDLDYLDVSVEAMLSKTYGNERAKEITDKAILPQPGKMEDSGTVYLATADKDGNMVSLIQSCFTGFGSGMVLPNWGLTYIIVVLYFH